MAQFYTLEGALALAAIVKAGITAGKIRLFKSSLANPQPTIKLADLVAAEADYSGYTAGGIAVTFGLPYYASGGGAAINTELAQFNYVFTTGTPVPNVIGGFWIDDGTHALVVGTFPTPVPMEQNGQAIPVAASLVFGV